MKKVILKSMALTNFKGHKDLTVNFSEQTTISGDNRLGKSTVFDAFVWLLFGKDQFDRKDHEIIPIINGQRLERVDPEVTAVIDVDGREISLKRVLHQKWVRRRGTAEEVFDGTETLFFWDEVPLKAGEYKARVDLLIEETIFKLITNPSTFLSLNWTKQREFLFQIAGTISDQQIAASNPNFQLLLDAINGKPFAEFKKELSARKRKLNDQLEAIGPKIDQTTRLMPEAKDWNEIEKELGSVESSILAIDQLLSDRSKAIRGQYEEIQRKQGEINGLKTKQRQIVETATTQAHQEAFAANQKRNEVSAQLDTASRKLRTAENELEEQKRALATLRQKSENKNNEIEQLRTDWETENAKEYTAKEGCLICPVFKTECGDPAAKGKHTEAQQAAEIAFFEAKERKLDQINKEGAAKKDELQFIEGRIKDAEKYLKEAEEKLEFSNDEYEKLKKQLAGMAVTQPRQIVASELPEWIELDSQIKAIEATITEVEPVDNSDLNERKSQLISTRDQLKKYLSDRELIARYNQEIKRLKNEAAEFAQQIADIEKQEFTMAEFTKVKIDECERRINNLFTIVKFQLFDKTIDGNEFECCIPLNKLGVPISATNTAEKINAGLDIIATLSAFYNVSAPIFCDQAESNNNYVNLGAQMIFLRVTKEKSLTISNN